MDDVPEGWKLVPIEPSAEQIAAMIAYVDANRVPPLTPYYDDCYTAMVNAAPNPPPAKEPSQ